MTDYRSNIDLSQAADLLNQPCGRVLITTHAKPDGDAFGGVVAMTAALRAVGRQVQALLVAPVPASFKTLHGWSWMTEYSDDLTIPTPDLVVVLDTGAWSQLEPVRAIIEPWMDRTLIVDHHLGGDAPARYKYIDAKAAACCEIVAQLLDQMQRPFDDTIREALFVGLASDTGWFRFSNTRPQTHELAARLQNEGVDHAALYQQLEQTDRPEKLALLIRALDSLELVASGRAAIMSLRASDFAETGAVLEETERFVDIPQSVADVQVVALVTEPPGCDAYWRESDQPDPQERRSANRCATRISFRSKPGEDAVNVANLAKLFGGGGHARAAGAKADIPLDQLLPKLRQTLEEALGN